MAQNIHKPFTTMRPIRTPVRITLSVGPTDAADISGSDDKAIQAAIDYVARLGGGVVQILPGTYALRNALYPRSGVILRGSGEDTILRKGEGRTTRLVRETDWFEYCVQVADPTGFCVGCGIAISSDKPEYPQTKCFTVTAIDGNVLYLDRRTDKNFWMCEDASVQSCHSLIHGWDVDDVSIEGLVLDGNAGANPVMNGNYAAGVFMQGCNRWQFHNVVSRNYNGDGFSFQVCDDIQFDSCAAEDNHNLGFHPGSGAQRPRFRNCRATGNGQGLFWCWGVCDGLAEHCTFAGNRLYGTNFGHRDTDNILRGCTIADNGEVGVLFRRETNEFRTPDRNILESCIIRDNGRLGVDVQWTTSHIVIRGCRFESTRPGVQSTAIKLDQDTGAVTLEDNTFHGCQVEVYDARTGDDAEEEGDNAVA